MDSPTTFKKKRLKVLCPSTETADPADPERFSSVFSSVPCTLTACSWWENNSCSAQKSLEESYDGYFDLVPLPPPCPKAHVCRWHIQATAEGKPACPPRRLGEVCEHVGGEWNTFQMVHPSEWGPPWSDVVRNEEKEQALPYPGGSR